MWIEISGVFKSGRTQPEKLY